MTRFLRTFAVLPILAFLWWLPADGDQGSWLTGIPAVLAAGETTSHLNAQQVLRRERK